MCESDGRIRHPWMCFSIQRDIKKSQMKRTLGLKIFINWLSVPDEPAVYKDPELTPNSQLYVHNTGFLQLRPVYLGTLEKSLSLSIVRVWKASIYQIFIRQHRGWVDCVGGRCAF